VRIPLRPESVGVLLKISLKYRLDYYLHRHLHHPVLDGRYPKRPLAAVRLRNIYPPYRSGFVLLPFQFPRYLFKILLCSAVSLLYALKCFAVYSGCTFVCFDKSIGMVWDVHPVYLVIEQIKTILLLLLGLLV